MKPFATPNLYDPLLDYEADEPPPSPRRRWWQRVRLMLYALLMLTILVGSSLLTTANALPSFLGYWQPHYRISFQQIREGTCSSRTDGTGILTPNDSYCVCGLLQAGEHTADFSLQIQPTNGRQVAKLDLHQQTSGLFCQTFTLEKSLPIGDYELHVVPRLSRQSVYGVRFQIQDKNPTI